jgi:co-chaperonin GroES (HSP10)
MKALGQFVVLRKVAEEVKNQSGLIMTEYTDKSIRYKLAEVVSVGDKVKDLGEGDKVYFDSAAGSDIRVAGQKLVVVPDMQIVVKL